MEKYVQKVWFKPVQTQFSKIWKFLNHEPEPVRATAAAT